MRQRGRHEVVERARTTVSGSSRCVTSIRRTLGFSFPGRETGSLSRSSPRSAHRSAREAAVAQPRYDHSSREWAHKGNRPDDDLWIGREAGGSAEVRVIIKHFRRFERP